MISNTATAEEIRLDWNGIEVFRRKLGGRTLLVGNSFFTTPVYDEAHNIPFLHACAILNNVLEILKDEGHFSCRSRELGRLQENSRNVLKYDNYSLINEIREARNGLAHNAKIYNKTDCWKYIDAIKSQLKSWEII